MVLLNLKFFLNFLQNARKNLGYLYTIQHGAKEIFEIDEDIVISDLNSFNFNISIYNVYYTSRNDSRMISPYIHFEERNIFPRGFRLNDIGHHNHNKFHAVFGRNLLLTPLKLNFLYYNRTIF